MIGKCSNDAMSSKVIVMRILKLAKYRLKVQVEKDEGPSGEGQSP